VVGLAFILLFTTNMFGLLAEYMFVMRHEFKKRVEKTYLATLAPWVSFEMGFVPFLGAWIVAWSSLSRIDTDGMPDWVWALIIGLVVLYAAFPMWMSLYFCKATNCCCGNMMFGAVSEIGYIVLSASAKVFLVAILISGAVV